MAIIPLAWKIISIAVAKKVTIYLLGRTYGFPRLYRRLVEFNRANVADRSRRRFIQERVKYIFRIPNKIGRFLNIGNNQSIASQPPRR